MPAPPVYPTTFPHWMLREIYEQPDALRATMGRYVSGGRFRSDTCDAVLAWLSEAREITVAASGSSRHAGMVAEILIEDLSGIPVDVEYSSEYVYRSKNATKHASVIVISQSGETADTLGALRKSRSFGHQTLAITNVDTSCMAVEADVSFPALAGRERAVPATKSFTTQVLNVYLLALMAAQSRQSIDAASLAARLDRLSMLPSLIESQLDGWKHDVQGIAEDYRGSESLLFLGRDLHYPIAREGALKLKESAYLHAEGYPSGELKHGPNALVGPDTSLVMIATVDRDSEASVIRHEKVIQLMEDMRQQGAKILAIATAGDTAVAALANHILYVDPVEEALLALCEVIPLQMFSYVVAVQSGIDVDNPRNLAKAVLVD
jgi:glucosamine--fructose-6-phosphate aminotransferase (isomerizing)